ncbi:MAG: RNase adapter RapZ [Oscillospiraceae bacterium]|nr:RNase adapter RapZ [Oscillospiraceae bacterium]
MEFLIVSGMSGAGKSRAVAVFEDLGYYCVDNMPAELIPMFAEMCIAAKGRFERAVLVVDTRGGVDFNRLFSALEELKGLDCTHRILFFEASAETIISRQRETRRKHPLQKEGMSMQQAIQQEIGILSGVRARADYIINTTSMSTSGLRQHLLDLFVGMEEHDRSMAISVMSFGFKYGAPPEADVMFDVRFLPNPFYLLELRPKTGLEPEVREYVLQNEDTQEFLGHLYSMIDYLVPQYIEEGKTTLVIGIGCTGGKHRSVVLSEELCRHINENGFRSTTLHRDIGRE